MDYSNKLFNPASQSKEWLIENFVVRTKVFNRIFQDISSSKMEYPEQHYIIQGQRGMGKTTLLLRLKYEIENSPELNKWLIPVFFNEESYDVTSLSNLWEKLLKYLDEIWGTGGKLYEQTNDFIGNEDYERKTYDLLIKSLKERNKKILLLFDNFGELFLNELNEKESHRLREILIKCEDIRIIGASAVVMDSLHDYKNPFFDFFKTIHLEPLSKEETFQLIEKLQQHSTVKIDINKSKAKIETLAILTGGVIRTIVLLYEVLLSDENGSALRDLEIILDRITPLYKHRMEVLQVNQRKIVDVVAKNWDAISAKDISKRIRENGKTNSSKYISAQLQQLEKNNIIEKKTTSTKNNLYQLKERFFNIWYLMRNGDRSDKLRVVWLTKYLEVIYGEKNEDFKFLIKSFIEKIQTGNYHADSALTLGEAITISNKISGKDKLELVKELRKQFKNRVDDLASRVDEEIESNVLNLIENKEYGRAIEELEQINNKSNQTYLLLAQCLLSISDYKKAELALNNIIDIEAEESSQYYFLLAVISLYKNEKEKAIEFFKKSHTDGSYVTSQFLAKTLDELNELDEAEKYYIEATRSKSFDSYQELFFFYLKHNKISDLHTFFEDLYKRNEQNSEFFLAHAYIEYQKFDKGLSLLRDLEKKNSEFPGVYLSIVIQDLTLSNEKRIKYLEHAIKLSNKSQNTFYSDRGAKFFLCTLYFLKNINRDKAVQYASEYIRPSYSSSFDLIIPLMLTWNNQFDRALEEFRKIEDSAYKNEIDFFDLFLTLLISKKQYHSALNLFNEKPILKELVKPTYYALLEFLKDEMPDELLKMGEELSDPVKTKLEQIKDYEKYQ